jgi:hypothetical protein
MANIPITSFFFSSATEDMTSTTIYRWERIDSLLIVCANVTPSLTSQSFLLFIVPRSLKLLLQQQTSEVLLHKVTLPYHDDWQKSEGVGWFKQGGKFPKIFDLAPLLI